MRLGQRRIGRILSKSVISAAGVLPGQTAGAPSLGYPPPRRGNEHQDESVQEATGFNNLAPGGGAGTGTGKPSC